MDNDKKTGIEKAREVNANLKGGIKATTTNEVELAKQLNVGICKFNDPELAKLFNESAQIGSENIQQSMPILKIHVANKSINNVLMNGKEPNDGWFFYSKTKEQFENPIVHVLSISRGFYVQNSGDDENSDNDAPKFNQVLAGVIDNDVEYLPFIMYFSGSTKLQHLWEFGKMVQPYTKMKPVSIPMFALTFKLSREKIMVDYTDKNNKKATTSVSYPVFNFVTDDENGSPVLVTDKQKFLMLRDLALKVEQELTSMVDSKDVGKDGMGRINQINNNAIPNRDTQAIEEGNSQNLEEDIPEGCEPASQDEMPF